MSFACNSCDITVYNVTPDIWNANTAQCLQLLENDTNWQSIPVLNYAHAENIRDQQLVRFWGMIQNMYNPEFFLSKYEVKNIITGDSVVRSGKFKDTVICKENERFVEDSEKNERSEREAWRCVPIPALNEWVSTSWRKTHLKRQHSRVEEQEHGASKKKLNNTRLSTEVSAVVNNALTLKLPEPNQRTCYLKLYDCDTNLYVLNDVVEVAGFVSFSDTMEDEGPTVNASDESVPRLHVVICKNLSQNISLLPEISLVDEAGSMVSVRNDLNLVLSHILLGDKLAADYLICHLVSLVHSRTEMMALGQLPLNIINIPRNDYVKKVYSVIESLVVKSVFLPMSLENLNRNALNPKKDYERDELTESLLQLSPHTHLVLDETQMQPGKLETLGMTNMTILRKLVLEQKIAYDFQYYEIDFNCDIPVLVFSEGKSLLPCSLVVPLEHDATSLQNLSETFQAVEHFLQPSMLQRIRAYIMTVQSLSNFTVDTEMQQIIQEDFVKLRQNKETNTSSDDLHNLIVLARLMCLSVGEQSLNHKIWEHVLTLEGQRKHRLAAVKHS